MIEARIPSPSEVPSPNPTLRTAVRNRLRSEVGGTATVAVPEKVTTPTWTDRGTSSTNCSTACCAASSRCGFTSVARIEFDVSSATMTDARCSGTTCSCAGRANASTVIAIAARNSAVDAWRCHPGRRGAAAASVRVVGNVTTNRRRNGSRTT